MSHPPLRTSDVPLLHPSERGIPESWKAVSLSALEYVAEANGPNYIPKDWIEFRIKQLKLLKLIDPDDPLTK